MTFGGIIAWSLIGALMLLLLGLAVAPEFTQDVVRDLWEWIFQTT